MQHIFLNHLLSFKNLRPNSECSFYLEVFLLATVVTTDARIFEKKKENWVNINVKKPRCYSSASDSKRVDTQVIRELI